MTLAIANLTYHWGRLRIALTRTARAIIDQKGLGSKGGGLAGVGVVWVITGF